MLAQQASGYDVSGHNFHIQEQSMHEDFNFSCVGTDQSAKPTDQVSSADYSSAVAKSAKPTTLVGQADTSKLAKPTALLAQPTPLLPARSICPRSYQIGPI